MKKRGLVTGGKGRIGTIISQDLREEFVFKLVDWQSRNEEADALQIHVANDYTELEQACRGMDAIIHLAWNSGENWKSNIVVSENKKMAENVYSAAVKAGVPRVIMASSIHADNFQECLDSTFKLTCDMEPDPLSFYGCTKVYIETLGKMYASRGLEVICVRFGGVSPDDQFRKEDGFEKIWLSRRDCANLIRCCLEAPRVPWNFSLFYGVSNNTARIHDWSNPLGWVPQDDSATKKNM